MSSKLYVLASTVAVAVVLGGWPSSASAETYTGCLTESGRIKKMQEGDKPRRRCDDDERQITLNSPGPEGPQGDKGDTGDAGAQGPKGDTGDVGKKGDKGDQGDQGEVGPAGPAGGPTVFEFVGYTGVKVTGDAGYVGLTQTCQAEYGLDARLCNGDEFAKSLTITTPPPDTAWIDRETNCVGWSAGTSTQNGGVVRDAGGLFVFPCDIARHVTCCEQVN